MNLEPAVSDYLAERERALGEVRQLLITSINLERAPDELDPDTALFGTGLGLDSLDAVEVVIGLDVQLGIKLEGHQERLIALRSVNALVDLVMRARGHTL